MNGTTLFLGRFAPLALLFALALAPARGAEAVHAAAPGAGPAGGEFWAGTGGWREELGAEELELRDETISAHLGYLSALELAMGELERLGPGNPDLPAAWARVEYLLETSFRLLESTGEHESFLRVTAGLKPDSPPPPEVASLDAADAYPDDEDGGLLYEDGDGKRLLPARINGVMTLVDADSAEIAADADRVSARPAEEEDPPRDASIQLIRARAAWLRAMALERLGRAGEARREAAGLGLVHDWLVLGPMDGDLPAASDIGMEADERHDFLFQGRDFTGKPGPVAWRPHVSIDPLGRLHLDALFRSEGRKTAYALTLAHSPENRAAVLRFGATAPAAVFINHIRINRERSTTSADPGQGAFNVWLRKGWNAILVGTTSAAAGEWAFGLRITGLDGRPFPCFMAQPGADNVDAILAEAAKAADRSSLERFYLPARPADMGGISILSRRLLADPGDVRANFYLASFLAARRMMEGPERFDRELIFLRAVELSDGNPFFTLMAARSVEGGVEGPEREENLRLVLLRAAADHGSAAALSDIGRLYLDIMRQPRRADVYAKEAMLVNPMSLRAGLLEYDAAMALGWRPAAGGILAKAAKLHPSAPPARLRRGRADLEDGRYSQALTEFHAVLDVDATSHEALNGAVMALGMLGQTSAAVDLLRSHMERFPYDSEVRLKLAGLYRTLGRDDQALAVLADALALAPDDARAMDMRLDIARETYAEGKEGSDPALAAIRSAVKQDLDMSPPTRPVPNGWEYLYFQVEDRMEQGDSMNRIVSFAMRVYSPSAARRLRHLAFPLDPALEEGIVTSLALIQPDGVRETLGPSARMREDGQAIVFNLPPLQPGVAVEAEVVFHRRRIPFLGDYFGQIAPLTQPAPTRLSRYMFTAPKDVRMYFRAANGAPEAMVAESRDGRTVTRIWEMNDLPAFVPEPASPGQNELMPCVQISSFGDWDEFARWYWRLFGGQYHTPPELRALARETGAGETLPLAKLERAAEWMSRNLGRREWEFGPYAFRPINARTILSRLSADGKDRTLLLYLLAREYGLRAWPVLARLRDSRFAPVGSDDLTLPLLEHFNHSLLMVKTDAGEDVFLDASNPYRPPGVMPSQLFGSPGMAIATGSAERIRVPDGGTAGCDWRETAEMAMDEDGSVRWEETVTGTGTAAETLRMRFRDPDARNDVWNGFLAGIGATPSASASEFSEDAASPDSATFSGRARLRRFASMADDRVVAAPPPLPGPAASTDRQTYPLSLHEYARQGVREQDLVLPYGFRLSRTLRITYPGEWRLVNQPGPFRLAWEFGSAELEVGAAPGELRLEFTAAIPGHRVAAKDFDAFRIIAALVERWSRPVLVWEK